MGTLVPSSFDIGTTTYTVTHLFDNDQFGGSTYVAIILSPVLSEDDAGSLTLHLGDDTSLSFGDATYSTGTGFSRHEWSPTAALGWSTDDAIVVGITQEEQVNTAPAFTTGAEFSRNENYATAFQVTAMDADAGDEVTYAVTGGADLAHFRINATGGLKTFLPFDHENPTDADGNNVYLVTVTATGGTGARALSTDQAINVTVTDVDEPPSAPAAPTVSAVSGTTYSLSVTWTAPDNSGKPAIESYDLQYRKGTTGNWIDGPQDETGTSATISGLDEDSAYQVRVRAINDVGDGAWSSPGSGSTGAQVNTAPSFLLESSTREVAENSAAGVDVGGPVTAVDTDGDDPDLHPGGDRRRLLHHRLHQLARFRPRPAVTYDHELQAGILRHGQGRRRQRRDRHHRRDHRHRRRGRAPLGPGSPHGLGRPPATTDSLEVAWSGPRQQRQAGHRVLRPAIPQGDHRQLD